MEKIVEFLNILEVVCDIQIIYACQSGSRTHGYNKDDSDYDVRFIYKKSPAYYLSINTNKKDTIEQKIDNIDASGWDIMKFCTQLSKGNPQLFEWIKSPIIYKEKGQFKTIIQEQLDSLLPINNIFHHYYYIANNHLKLFSKNNYDNKIKSYCFVIKSIITMIYLMEYKTLPETINIYELLNLIEGKDILKYKIPIDLINKIVEFRMNNKIPLESEDIRHIEEWCFELMEICKHYITLLKAGSNKISHKSINDKIIETLDKIIYSEITYESN